MPKGNKNSSQKSRSTRRTRAPIASGPAPSPPALDIAARASKRVKDRSTPVRETFIARTRGSEPDARPPLARLLGGSRGGALRIRLFLALLWQAGGGDERHAVSWPARAWAELLDLPNPERLGDRRVRSAFRSLQSAGLLGALSRPGRPSSLTLLRDDGSRAPYIHPGEEAQQAKSAGVFSEEHVYVQLPATFWTQGWALVLDGPGLAMLLIMLVLTHNGDRADQWVSPAQARSRFGVSEDTWGKGVAELRDHRLLRVRKRPVSEDFGWRRVRNTYTLDVGRLGTPPA